MNDIAGMQRVMLEKCDKQFLEYLASSLLPSLGCDQRGIEMYVTAVKDLSPKEWQAFFKVRITPLSCCLIEFLMLTAKIIQL